MAKHNKVWIPAVIAVIAGLVLIAYSFYAQKSGIRPMPPGGGEGMPPREEEAFEPFKLMGTLSVVLGGISFMWMRFKKKLTSTSGVIKKAGRLLYRVHPWTGWAALALVLIHGVYYLFTKLQDHAVFTGLAAFVILLTLAGYGWSIKRARGGYKRKVHFFLSIAWIPALLLHAGGSAVLTVVVSALVWMLVPMVERWTQSRAA
ncbi:hypothetical protein ACP26L_04310 [Paenibacillus sp. S-38]|uniref:hypothetical protein n=1 Tax=Paenibacillus sp. S-38 TaxID=3416710 RepID=UPI003CF9EE91